MEYSTRRQHMVWLGILATWLILASCAEQANQAVALPSTIQAVELSPEQRAYLKQLGPITVCPDPDWVPFELVDDHGHFTGIAADLLDLLADRLDISFTLVIPEDWDDALERSRSGEVLILPFLNQTPERSEWLLFTQPLLSDPNVFITREEHPFITDVTALGSATIIFPSGTSMEERVRQDFPDLQIITTERENEVFQAIDRRQADLTLRSLTIAAYTIRKEGLFNLKIAGQAPEAYTNHLRMGVLNSEPMLRDILNAGIATITAAERAAIVNRHVNITVVTPFDYALILRLAALLVALMGVSFYWNLRLRRSNRALDESERSKSVLLSHLPGVAYRCRDDERWTLLFISQGCKTLTGHAPEDLLVNRTLSFTDLIAPEDRGRVRQAWDQGRHENRPVIMEYRIRRADGQERWVFDQGRFVTDANAEEPLIEGLIIDITDRKQAEAERERLLTELQASLAEIKTLRGIIPICAWCKKIRDDQGYWEKVEDYIKRHSSANFTHGICPDCKQAMTDEMKRSP